MTSCQVAPSWAIFSTTQKFAKQLIRLFFKHDSFPISSELEHAHYCPSDYTGLLGLLAIEVDDLTLAVLRVLSLVPPAQAFAEGNHGLRVQVTLRALSKDRRQALSAKSFDFIIEVGIVRA